MSPMPLVTHSPVPSHSRRSVAGSDSRDYAPVQTPPPSLRFGQTESEYTELQEKALQEAVRSPWKFALKSGLRQAVNKRGLMWDSLWAAGNVLLSVFTAGLSLLAIPLVYGIGLTWRFTWGAVEGYRAAKKVQALHQQLAGGHPLA